MRRHGDDLHKSGLGTRASAVYVDLDWPHSVEPAAGCPPRPKQPVLLRGSSGTFLPVKGRVEPWLRSRTRKPPGSTPAPPDPPSTPSNWRSVTASSWSWLGHPAAASPPASG